MQKSKQEVKKMVSLGGNGENLPSVLIPVIYFEPAHDKTY